MKNWPYWVKGGINFLFASILVLICLLFLSGGGASEGLVPLYLAITFPLGSIFVMHVGDSSFQNLISIIAALTSAIINIFIIGAIIGWIYGKIMNSNKI